MNSLDLFFVIILSFFFIRGVFRGFVLELTTVIGLVVGYLFAISYLSIVTAFLQKYLPSLLPVSVPVSILNIISFMAIFVATNLFLRFIAGIVTKTLKFAMLGWVNKLLGGFFGLCKSVLILSIITLIIDFIPIGERILASTGIQNSMLFPLFNMIGPKLFQYIMQLSNFL
jgi:membrane protein required for colicin V production